VDATLPLITMNLTLFSVNMRVTWNGTHEWPPYYSVILVHAYIYIYIYILEKENLKF
jgi:hypothetical protein